MSENNTSDQISLLIALFIVLLVLKLTGYITWSWWLVTAPLWLVPALFFVIIAIIICLGLVGLILYGLYKLIILIFIKH